MKIAIVGALMVTPFTTCGGISGVVIEILPPQSLRGRLSKFEAVVVDEMETFVHGEGMPEKVLLKLLDDHLTLLKITAEKSGATELHDERFFKLPCPVRTHPTSQQNIKHDKNRRLKIPRAHKQ